MTGLEIMLFFQNLRELLGNFPTQVFLFISDKCADALAVTVPCFIYWCVSKKDGTFVMLNLLSGNIAVQTLKSYFCVLRPWIRYPDIHPVQAAIPGASGYSLPSGHAGAASAVFGGVAWLYRRNRAVLWLCVVYITLVCLSRCWLGVHMPTEVAAGCAAGFAAVCVNKKALGWCGDSRSRFAAVAAVYSLASFAVIFYSVQKEWAALAINGSMPVSPYYFFVTACYSAGALNGFLAGILLERKFVNFTVSADNTVKLARFAGGFILYLLCYKFLGFFVGIPHTETLAAGAAKFAAGFLTMLYVCAVYPMIFCRLEIFWRERGLSGPRNREE